MSLLRQIVHRAGRWYIRQICASESRGQKFSHHNERSIEYRFAFEMLAKYRPRTVLDVGSGTTAWPHLLRNCGYVVSAVDNVRDYWPKGMVNRHWTVEDVDILDPGDRIRGVFDSISCLSVIEHIEQHLRAVKNMAALLGPAGILILTTPYAHEFPHPNVYTHPDALYGRDLPYICRSSSRAEIEQWLAFGFTLEERELWRMFSGPLWATGQRCEWKRVGSDAEPHQLGCFVFRKVAP
jgi:SAM-dependent methyltransferase